MLFFNEGRLFHVLDDRIAQRCTIVFISFVIWSFVFLFLYSRPTTPRLRNKAEEFKVGVRTHRAELATRSVAAVHAILVSFGSFSLLFLRQNSNLWVPRLFQPETWAKFDTYNEDALFYCCVSSGFFLADILLCVIQFEEQGWQFIIHALAGLSGCSYCLYTGEGLLYLMMMMLFEISTPFLHLRWWLMEYGHKNGVLYKINGVLLVSCFTVFRLLIGTPVMLKMIHELHTKPEADRHHLAMRATFTLAPLAMIVLNTMWGVVLWKGMLEVLGVLKKKKKKH